MNHTTRLRETRAGQGIVEDYTVDEFNIGKAGETDETLSEE
jgi:hypothetical protein